VKSRSISLALALLAGSAWAQGQDYQAMAKAMEQAQAEASRPGDEKLTCEQLEEQLTTIAQSPEFLAHVEATGAEAQKQQEAMQTPKGQIAVQTFRAVIMSTMQGAALPGMAHAQAQATAQGAKGMKLAQERMERAKKMTSMLPMLMRGQRVIELASGKGCEWAASAGTGQ
jgi:hypothetical protein